MPNTNTPVPSISQTFEPFSWHGKPILANTDNLLETAKDVGSGIALVLQIIEDSELAESHDDGPPMFNAAYRAILLRFAMSSANLLSEAASNVIEWSIENEKSRS